VGKIAAPEFRNLLAYSGVLSGLSWIPAVKNGGIRTESGFAGNIARPQGVVRKPLAPEGYERHRIPLQYSDLGMLAGSDRAILRTLAPEGAV